MARKGKKIYTAEDLFDMIPGEKVNNINNIKESKEASIKTENVKGVEYTEPELNSRYICSEIFDQGLMFVVNDGDKDYAKCMIVLPEYSNLIGENRYLDPTKKYVYMLMNEVNIHTMKRRVTARVLETDDFEAETGIRIDSYFRTKDNIEVFADEIAEHINLIRQCNTKEAARTVALEIMKRALHP